MANSRQRSTAPSTLYSPVDAFSTKPLETTANGAPSARRLHDQRRVHHWRLCGRVRHPLDRRRADHLHRARLPRSSPGASVGRSGPLPPATHRRRGEGEHGRRIHHRTPVGGVAIENELGTAAARNYVRKNGAVTITGLKTFQDGAEFGVGQQGRARAWCACPTWRDQVAQGRTTRATSGWR